MVEDPRAPDAKHAALALPLYVQILIGLALGAVAGLLLGPRASAFDVPTRLVLRLLGALAPVLILVAVVRAIMNAEVGGRVALRLAVLLGVNTLVAIAVGLTVANVLRPGAGVALHPSAVAALPDTHILAQLFDNVPDSLVKPFVENRVIGVVLIALAFGVAGRSLEGEARRVVDALCSAAFSLVLSVLSWVLLLVPLAVFGKVASIVGVSGFSAFVGLAWFVLAVLVALALQASYYLLRIRLGSWVRPLALLRGTADALVMAFSTGSSTITMPVTYQRLRNAVGLGERAASLGALVGSNFNNDGTALYEAMAALFVAQLLGVPLSLGDQLTVVVTSVIASVGAAGIPEAGLVTMTLVFTAVKLPTEYIALLLSVDWFLDRCRTAINVMGDMSVACLLEPRRPTASTVALSSDAVR
jgi:DAACS family dicarboxylate/amino acid:cation (Na+ or H+) symporter